MGIKKKIAIILIVFFTVSVILYSQRHYLKERINRFLMESNTSKIKRKSTIDKSEMLFDSCLESDSVLINSNSIIESIDGYAQGGVVVGNYAFFSAQYKETAVQRKLQIPKHSQYPYVCKIDISNFEIVNTFDFKDTYDSSPLVVVRKAGDTIVIAHEHKTRKTVAFNINNSNKIWESVDNQSGHLFFGYSYYNKNDNSKIIFASSKNGLHALSSEDGQELWFVKAVSMGGVTPAVDQSQSKVYYQADNIIYKLNAVSGEIEKKSNVEGLYTQCVSWNTVFAEFKGQKFIITYWYNSDNGKGTIRVYNEDLTLLWEKSDLATSKKATLTYHNSGKIIIGCGNTWKPFGGNEWKKINAYNVATGAVEWKCDLKKFEFVSILNVPAYNNYLYAETQDDLQIASSKIFKINALTGHLEEVFYYGKPVTSCATSIIAKGCIFSGDLYRDEINIIRIAENSNSNWGGAFGDPQTNQMSIIEDSVIYKPMSIIGKTVKTYSKKIE